MRYSHMAVVVLLLSTASSAAVPVNDAMRLVSKSSKRPPLASQDDLDSPAHRQYQELIKANDLTVTTAI